MNINEKFISNIFKNFNINTVFSIVALHTIFIKFFE